MAKEPFLIEALISRDIVREIGDAQVDEVNGFHDAAEYRCRTARGFCVSLIARLDDVTGEDNKK